MLTLRQSSWLKMHDKLPKRKITVGHRLEIVANHYFPLSKAFYV